MQPLEDHLPAAASELNNLLHIIAGTTDLIDNIWHDSPSSEKYLQMLRNSVDRAASVTAQLVGDATATDGKVIVHPAACARVFGTLQPKWPATPQRETNSAAHILVVDDEPMALVLAEKVLALGGYKVTCTRSGFECLSVFTANPTAFALVLLDLTMPCMDGEETFDQLRAINPQIPVLLNTGFAARNVADRMFSRGLAGLITKPIAPGKLLAKIASALASIQGKPAHGTTAAM